MGPTAATPEHFVQALSADRSTWRVMDRGPFEALVPITEVIDNTVKDSLDSLEIEQLQVHGKRDLPRDLQVHYFFVINNILSC